MRINYYLINFTSKVVFQYVYSYKLACQLFVLFHNVILANIQLLNPKINVIFYNLFMHQIKTQQLLKIIFLLSLFNLIDCTVQCFNTAGQFVGDCDCGCGFEDPNYPMNVNCAPCVTPGPRPAGYDGCYTQSGNLFGYCQCSCGSYVIANPSIYTCGSCPVLRWYQWFLIAVGVVAIITAIIVIVRWRRKRMQEKKQAELTIKQPILQVN